MVKISDPEASKKYNIMNTPSLVYFRKRIPLTYDGKFVKNQLVLSVSRWLQLLLKIYIHFYCFEIEIELMK